MKPGRPDRSLPALARIWVLLASEASTAVIFRRGPSRWTRLYLWNTKTDEITPGSWFRGRLYEDMSDLSPDGKHLLYFARNEERQRQEAARETFGVEHLFAWVALSRPPQVKALGLWNVGAGAVAGGVFTGNQELQLHLLHSPDGLINPQGFRVTALPGGEGVPILLTSLERRGWQGIPQSGYSFVGPLLPLTVRIQDLELRLSEAADFRLDKTYRWHGQSSAPDLEGASWADLDQQGRLVYARDGRLYAFVKGHEILLADLNLDQPPARLETKTTD